MAKVPGTELSNGSLEIVKVVMYLHDWMEDTFIKKAKF